MVRMGLKKNSGVAADESAPDYNRFFGNPAEFISWMADERPINRFTPRLNLENQNSPTAPDQGIAIQYLCAAGETDVPLGEGSEIFGARRFAVQGLQSVVIGVGLRAAREAQVRHGV